MVGVQSFIDNFNDTSLCEIKSALYFTYWMLTDITKIPRPNTGILIPLLYYQNMKNFISSFRSIFVLCLGIVEFKIKTSTQEISLERKGCRIYDSMQRGLYSIRIIYQNGNIWRKNTHDEWNIFPLHNHPTTYHKLLVGHGDRVKNANFSSSFSGPPHCTSMAMLDCWGKAQLFNS